MTTSKQDVDVFLTERNEILRARIDTLESALRKINRINDHPAKFNSAINDVLIEVIPEAMT